MAEQAKNSINNSYRFMRVLNAQWTLQSIATSDAFNKIGLNNTSLSALAKTQQQEIRYCCRMFRELKLQRLLSKNQMTKVS